MPMSTQELRRRYKPIPLGTLTAEQYEDAVAATLTSLPITPTLQAEWTIDVSNEYRALHTITLEGGFRLDGVTEPIGEFIWYIFRPRTHREIRESVFRNSCEYDAHAAEFATALLDNSDVDPIGILTKGPIALWRSMKLEPAYRGHGWGIAASRAIAAHLRTLLGLHIVFLKPYPIDQPAAARPDFTLARQHLTAYYQRALRLTPVLDTGYFYWDLDID